MTSLQDSEPSTVMGKVYDRFTKRCHSATYLRERKEIHQAGIYIYTFESVR